MQEKFRPHLCCVIIFCLNIPHTFYECRCMLMYVDSNSFGMLCCYTDDLKTCWDLHSGVPQD